jgi:[ribosomal protein S5]-alanine N-acetyltransferase
LIETERLTVRLPQAADVPGIVSYYGNNRDHLQPFSPTFAPDFLDETMWQEQVRMRTHEHAAGESFRAFVFLSSNPDGIVGNLNLTQVHRGALQSCVLGYNLARDQQGKGYMTEAVNGAVAFAFEKWRLHRVTANHMPRNDRSAAVLRRCGFQVEGLAPAYLLINGRWEDHVLTAIVNPAVTAFDP